MSGVWLVRATNPGIDSFLADGTLRLDCHVREDITGLTPEQVRQAGPSKRHGRELAGVLQMQMGDLVIGTDANLPNRVWIGRVCGDYRYEPTQDEQHPHCRAVDWQGSVSRSELRDQGVQLPGIWVTALAPVEVTQDVARFLLQVKSVDSRPPVRGAGRRQSATAPAAKSTPVGTAPAMWNHDLATLPRLTMGTPDWRDHALADEPLLPVGGGEFCEGFSRHRYVMPVTFAASPDGPNVLVVAANPRCPDDSGTFVRQVGAMAETMGAATCGVVNLITRRTGAVADLAKLSADDLVGPRQRHVIQASLNQAEVVVLAHGRAPSGPAGSAFRAEWDFLYNRLRELQDSRGLLVLSVDGKATQPSRGAALLGRLALWNA